MGLIKIAALLALALISSCAAPDELTLSYARSFGGIEHGRTGQDYDTESDFAGIGLTWYLTKREPLPVTLYQPQVQERPFQTPPAPATKEPAPHENPKKDEDDTVLDDPSVWGSALGVLGVVLSYMKRKQIKRGFESIGKRKPIRVTQVDEPKEPK
jgi:hypothetical protein